MYLTKDLLVMEVICVLPGHSMPISMGTALRPAGRIPSGRSYLCSSGSASAGSGALAGIASSWISPCPSGSVSMGPVICWQNF